MKVLSGVYPAGSYGGEIFIDGESRQFRGIRDSETVGVAIIFQELSLVKELTVGRKHLFGREPSRFGIVNWGELYARAGKLLERFASSDKSAHIGRKSRHRLAAACRNRQSSLAKRAHLVLDEPTAALTESEVETLFEILKKLKARGVGMIYISHKLDEVFRMSDLVTVLRDGKTVGTNGRKI
jgi:D-xylose transport system ATP-binding protein